jgi:hypothetical protein
MNQGAYLPYVPAKRPTASPSDKPLYRVLVHRKFKNHWDELVERVGETAAAQFWDHVAHTPGQKPPIASTTILKGKAGDPIDSGWSRTYHYEISGAGRIDYQFHNDFQTTSGGDKHKIVAIMTINYSSH